MQGQGCWLCPCMLSAGVRAVCGSLRPVPAPEVLRRETGFSSLSQQGALLLVSLTFSSDTYSSSSSVFFPRVFLAVFSRLRFSEGCWFPL